MLTAPTCAGGCRNYVTSPTDTYTRRGSSPIHRRAIPLPLSTTPRNVLKRSVATGVYREGVVIIHRQFNGPAHSGNGGYVCGLIASQIDTSEPVTAMLRQPPPLDTALSWEHHDNDVHLL